MAPAPGSFLSICCYEYHELIVFMMVTVGIILFVVSLQEGFYAYQFRMLGWTLASALIIISGCSGLLLSLWKCRMWFFYTVCCITARNLIDHLVGSCSPLKIRMLMLKPEATLEGFIAGIIASFAFFAIVSATRSLLPFLTSFKLFSYSPSHTLWTRIGSCKCLCVFLWSPLMLARCVWPRDLCTKRSSRHSGLLRIHHSWRVSSSCTF